MRYRYYECLPDTKRAYEKCAARIEERMSGMTDLTITPENREIVIAKCKVAHDFWTNMQEGLAAQAKHEDPKITHDAANQHFTLLESECNAIFNKPPPKPKAEEKPEEEKPAEDKPAEDKPAEENAEAKPAEDVEMAAPENAVSADDLS